MKTSYYVMYTMIHIVMCTMLVIYGEHTEQSLGRKMGSLTEAGLEHVAVYTNSWREVSTPIEDNIK